MVMIGDHDIYRPEHAMQMLRLIPSAQLGVLPAPIIFAVWTHPEWLLSMITAFPDAPLPQASQGR
jgi:hypothetical protein